jgi:hypothetical protein
MVDVGGIPAYWVEIPPKDNSYGELPPMFVTGLPDGGTVLVLDLGRVGNELALLPGLQTLLGSPFSLSLGSDTLSVTELVEIAQTLEVRED